MLVSTGSGPFSRSIGRTIPGGPFWQFLGLAFIRYSENTPSPADRQCPGRVPKTPPVTGRCRRRELSSQCHCQCKKRRYVLLLPTSSHPVQAGNHQHHRGLLRTARRLLAPMEGHPRVRIAGKMQFRKTVRTANTLCSKIGAYYISQHFSFVHRDDNQSISTPRAYASKLTKRLCSV